MSEQNARAVLITGASRGIGRALALRLAQSGATVIINYRRDEQAASSAAAEVVSRGGRAVLVPADVADAGAVEAMFTTVRDQVGRLDGLVVNAAASAFKPLADIRTHHVERTMAITITGFLDLVRLATPLLAQSKGRIVAVSGWDSFRVLPGHGLLGAAKAAMEAMTRYLAVELAPHGITVVGVCPGPVDTDSFRYYAGAAWTQYEASWLPMTPSGRFPDANDIADVIELFLARQSYWVNGQTVVADGGISLTTMPS
jgi:enoyl-[acyl-carrier protein] reductase III